MATPTGSSCAGALAASQLRASARNAASSGLSLKSILSRLHLTAWLHVQQAVRPKGPIAKMHRKHALAPVIEMAVRLERVSDAAVYLQVLACGHLEASYSRQARGGGGGRQIVRRRFRRPSAIIGVRARKLGRHRNIGELVLDSLKAPEWATEYLA